jgi:hypothetical protein
MGLDWVVLEKEQNGFVVNPTEVIQAKRATREDAEVLAEMLSIWKSGDQSLSFEEFVEDTVSQEIPPVVIPFGDGFQDAIPAFQAEVQYYGYRGMVLESRINCISRFAEQSGYDFSWIFGELTNQNEIVGKIKELEQIYKSFQPANRDLILEGEKYYKAWRERNQDLQDKLEEAYLSKGESYWNDILSVYSFLGAIDWLRFWSDKGFIIAADY